MSGGEERIADVCLILEGTYPYVAGGVSSWAHDLIATHEDLSFQLVTLLPRDSKPTLRYTLPANVLGVRPVFVQRLPAGARRVRDATEILARLEEPLLRLQSRGTLGDVAAILDILAPSRRQLGRRVLLDSRFAWDLLLRMYGRRHAASSFLDYFWTWRALLGGLYSVLLAEVPPARVYHAVSTGYAGLLAARAFLETGRPVMLTEHGIYTNERRIEIAMADWLAETPHGGLRIDRTGSDLKDLWVDTIVSFSRACYEASSIIITLFEGNQQFQIEDGAAPEKLAIVPNGVDVARFSSTERVPDHPPTVALIGRVVPIKDIKTFIRACALLRATIPDLQALVMGPSDEDERYFQECVAMVRHMALEGSVRFTGRVRLEDHLGRVDVVALTSISEAQPLVLLEAGAAGIPSVATDVGSCREIVLGSGSEDPPLGPAGAVVPLSNPAATAAALARLLTDREHYRRSSAAIRERVRRYYCKADLDRTYRELYDRYRFANSSSTRNPTWQESVSSCGS